MVEVGYSIDPAERRKGYARAALKVMVQVGRADERVKVVRASITPENVRSKNLVVSEGFTKVGAQWDDEDGEEIIWELGV
jgi:ribosomal-protein-alanine N-acetyltransferase